jgi:ABC-2 type transport system ATP-binding protein
VIHAKRLTRHFRVKKETVEAVRGIDIDVAEGELLAFLGPNGAGKSTTLRMLTSLLPPTSGTATVAGANVTEDPAGVRKRIGYIGQGNGAGHYYRVRDELVMQGRFYGMTKVESRRRAGELLESLDLRDLAKRSVLSLSGGQRRRLDIAMGLMHQPRLMFLDEPSTGMDPQNRANLWEHILRMRAEHGTTIVLTTHYLEEADAMAERVVVIDNGLIIADDTAANLKAKLAGDRIAFTVPASDAEKAERLLAERGDLQDTGSGLTDDRRHAGAGLTNDRTVVVGARVDGGAELLPVLVREADAVGVRVLAATLRQPTLDDVFLNLTGRSLREGGEN